MERPFVEGVDAVFTVVGEQFVPSALALGPWGPGTMNGRVVGGLAAWSLEARYGDPDFLPARLTVDLLRPSLMVPLTVTTRSVREGKRIRVADAELHQDEVLVARATLVFLRRSAQPPGRVWTADDAMAVPSPFAYTSASASGEGTGDDPALLMRAHSEGGDNDRPGLSAWEGTHRKGIWIREKRPLVAGEPLTPFLRAALAGDITSALTHWGTAGLHFINTDYTLTLSRLPEGHDIGLRASTHLSAEGVATGSATFFDHRGPIGTCTAVALANSIADFQLPSERPSVRDTSR